MKNKIKILLFSLVFLVLSGTSSQAFLPTLKMDISNMVTQVTQTVTDTARTVGKKVRKVSEKALNKLNSAYNSSGLASFVGKAKSYYETGKALADDAADAYRRGESLVAEGESIYNDATDLVTTAQTDLAGLQNTVSAVDDVTGQLSLSAQVNLAESKLNEYKTSRIAEFEAENEELLAEIAQYQYLLDTTTDDDVRAGLEEQIETLSGGLKDLSSADSIQALLNNDADYSQYLSDLTSLKDKMSELKDAASSMFSMVKKLTSAQVKEKYDSMLSKNFLAEDEEETSVNNARVFKNRREEFYTDSVYALTTGANYQTQVYTRLKEFERISQNIPAVDYMHTSKNLLIEMRVNDIKILASYTELLIADLRRKTSRSLLSFPTRRSDYTKDPSVLNLDDYIFTEDDIKNDSGKTDPLDKVLQSL